MERQIDVISSDHEIISGVKESLPEYEVRSFRSLENYRKSSATALIIDSAGFPDIDSIQFLLSKLRKKIQNLPVLAVFKSPDAERIPAFIFIDDFIFFPFRKSELNARLGRLTGSGNEDDDSLIAGGLSINLKEYTVYSNNEKVDLTFKEFEILRLFMTSQKKVFSREDLLNQIWGIEYIGGTRTVDVHIRRLRSKLGDEFDKYIETVRNVGYRWIG